MLNYLITNIFNIIRSYSDKWKLFMNLYDPYSLDDLTISNNIPTTDSEAYKNYIDHIQITNHETLGVGERTQFYDATGALRDMTQSHLLHSFITEFTIYPSFQSQFLSSELREES